MNKKYVGRAILSDMDHTLLDANGQLSEINRAGILEFIDGGGLFGIATGRTTAGVLQFGKTIPMNIPGVVYNGSVIYDFKSNKVLSSYLLNKLCRKAIVRIMEIFPDVGVELHTTEGLYIIRQTDETDKHLERELINPTYASIDNVPDEWYKVLLTRDPQLINEVDVFASDWLNDNCNVFRTVLTEPQFLEFLPNNVSKGTALMDLIGILDLDCEKIISIGDNMNDLEMIKVAGTGIAVSNALDSVKNIADIVGCSNKENIIRWTLDNVL